MREITSKKTKITQIVTEEQWLWLVKRGYQRNFTVKIMQELTVPNIPKIEGVLLKPKVVIKKKKND